MSKQELIIWSGFMGGGDESFPSCMYFIFHLLTYYNFKTKFANKHDNKRSKFDNSHEENYPKNCKFMKGRKIRQKYICFHTLSVNF